MASQAASPSSAPAASASATAAATTSPAPVSSTSSFARAAIPRVAFEPRLASTIPSAPRVSSTCATPSSSAIRAATRFALASSSIDACANASAARKFGFRIVAPPNAFHGRFLGSTSTGRAPAAANTARHTAAESTPFE